MYMFWNQGRLDGIQQLNRHLQKSSIKFNLNKLNLTDGLFFSYFFFLVKILKLKNFTSYIFFVFLKGLGEGILLHW